MENGLRVIVMCEIGFSTRTVAAAAEAAQISNSADAILTFTFFKISLPIVL